ncbi:phosphatase PAP2 family protein [Candidatus Methylobacter favarea]|uniref:phosphatase PAP2 family protein n=1 Tax=Candidatus Methylobacter favarea TaxID=2707345 RepID=UPI00157D392A|nr:phosphatase PAP2 family protein [Candidatus Methylobacter favarea]
MTNFDLNIITYINKFSHNSWVFDKAVSFLSGCHLLKGGLFVTIIWWAWYKNDERQSHNREHLIATLLCFIFALLLGRILALTLPFRFRPLHEKNLVFSIPYGMEKTTLEDWNSFPSDHAVLFFALSTGLLFLYRKIGAFTFAYTILFICLPRIYLGLHYPTDIIAGAVIGMTMASLGNIYLVRSKIVKLIKNWALSFPHLFYPLFFILSYQIVNMFEDIRFISNGIYKLF